MNTKTILGFLIAGSLTVVSCKKELQPQESPAAAEISADATARAPQMQAPETPQQQVQMQQPVPQQPATTAIAPGMNPPHGQPNHRCDIAVGAPLNSPPGQNPNANMVQPQAQAQPVQPQAQAQKAPTVTPAGMNPPHGEPGHRCDVAVGDRKSVV